MWVMCYGTFRPLFSDPELLGDGWDDEYTLTETEDMTDEEVLQRFAEGDRWGGIIIFRRKGKPDPADDTDWGDADYYLSRGEYVRREK